MQLSILRAAATAGLVGSRGYCPEWLCIEGYSGLHGTQSPGLGIGEQRGEMHSCLGSAAVLVATYLAWLLCHWHCWVFSEHRRSPQDTQVFCSKKDIKHPPRHSLPDSHGSA